MTASGPAQREWREGEAKRESTQETKHCRVSGFLEMGTVVGTSTLAVRQLAKGKRQALQPGTGYLCCRSASPTSCHNGQVSLVPQRSFSGKKRQVVSAEITGFPNIGVFQSVWGSRESE